MDFFEFDMVKGEKIANAMLRSCRIQSITKLFRLVEVCLGLVLFSWISCHLPVAVKIFGDYFRKLFFAMTSHVSVFLVTNAIILVIFTKARDQVNHNAEKEHAEFVKNSDIKTKQGSEWNSLPHETDEVVYQDKRIICEVSRRNSSFEDEERETIGAKTDSEIVSNADSLTNKKAVRRTQSEKLRDYCQDKATGMLRRSETVNHRRNPSSCKESFKDVYEVDDLSNEDFNRTIEAFIAKQARFHREEIYAVVLHEDQTLG